MASEVTFFTLEVNLAWLASSVKPQLFVRAGVVRRHLTLRLRIPRHQSEVGSLTAFAAVNRNRKQLRTRSLEGKSRECWQSLEAQSGGFALLSQHSTGANT